MNEKGLAVTHANTSPAGLPHDPDKPQVRHNFVERLVAESDTVKQAVALARVFAFPSGLETGLHIMLVDASGDAAVLEWVDGEMRVIQRDGSSSRCGRGLRILPQAGEATAKSVFAALKEISMGGFHRGEELAKGENSVALSTIFSNPVPFEKSWRDENGPVVRKAAE